MSREHAEAMAPSLVGNKEVKINPKAGESLDISMTEAGC